MNEAYLGGTFDPIHVGHLWIAQQICEGLKLDRVCIVPNYSKASSKWDKRVVASNEQRLEMCKLAVRGMKQIDVCQLEIEFKYLYTYQTVEHILSYRSVADYLKVKWIVGGDWFDLLKTFKNYERLVQKCEFIVIDRPGVQNVTALLYKPVIEFKLSSSCIRQRLLTGLPVTGLVTKDVERFIKKEGLYVPRKSS